jgi:hypothetical protein
MCKPANWTNFAGAEGILEIVSKVLPPVYTVNISGHWVDVSGKTVYFRLQMIDEKENITYFPTENGIQKYMYHDHCRLEHFNFEGIFTNLDVGKYKVILQVKNDTTVSNADYSWCASYGFVQLTTW